MREAKRMVVYSIRISKGAPTKWVRIGSAFENRDGSINIYLDALPVDGRLHLRDVHAELPEPEHP